MKIPYRLARRPVGHPATALLVLGAEASDLLGLCAGLGLDPRGRVFALSGGMLLKLDAPRAGAFSPAIRLRSLAGNLLIPADAELIPALLDDEAAGLTRDRGLIFLPGGEVLGFDPRSPVDPASLIACERLPRRPWHGLPDPPRLAERIEDIRADPPGDGVDEVEDAILDPGNEEIGSELPRPPASGAGSGAIGRAAMGAGRGMMWLGKKLGLKGLAGLGAGWVRRTMEMAPRLGESVIGKQSAALRELLREFREGDPERALRHALPMSDPGGTRGAGFDDGGQLSAHDTTYDLDALLRGDDGGSARVWLGGQDVMAELIREYRQAAERALKRGDYRRAAYIYGKLLRDFRLAAHALMRGGLHRDAARLFLARLDDPKSAAMAYESAGEVDRAIELYRRVGEHEAAGDLLRKIGEEEAALVEFRLAADRLAASSAGHLAAGDLIRKKTGRAEEALSYYQAGWRAWPLGNASACGLRIARHHAERGEVAGLMGLMDEAEVGFSRHGDDAGVGQFYREIASLAERGNLREARDDLRDRALMGVARRLREHAEKGGTKPKASIARLMGDLATWTPAVARDAEYALDTDRGVKPAAGVEPPPSDRLGIGNEKVTAATFAPAGEEVFYGFESGQVVCFRPRTDEILLVTGQGKHVEALAASQDGRYLVVLQTWGEGQGRLNTFERKPEGSYRLAYHLLVKVRGVCWLTPILGTGGDERIGFFDGDRLGVMDVGLTSIQDHSPVVIADGPQAALLLPSDHRADHEFLVHNGSFWQLYDPEWGFSHPLELGGPLARPITPAIRNIACHRAAGFQVEIAYITPHGGIDWAILNRESGPWQRSQQSTSGSKGGYEAVVIARPGVVAGVGRKRIDWFHTRAKTFSSLHSVACDFESIGAAFPCRRTGELIVIDGLGRIRRINSI